MSFWDNTAGNTGIIDLGTCMGTTGTTTWFYPYDNCQDSNNYTYQYHYYTDPKLIELIKEVLALLKEVLKEKKRKKR